MTNHLVPMIMYGLAIIALLVRLYTGEKRDFIISISLIVIGSIYATITIPASTLTLFMIAVLLSFIGDLLMAQWIRFTEHRTIDGIIAFGFAHVFYIIAFNRLNIGGFQLRDDWWLVVLGLVFAVVMFKKVADDESLHTAIRVSNGAYTLIIAMMLVFVLSFVFTPTTPLIVKVIAFLGGILFVTSDGILAYNEFQSPMPGAKDIIAVTYILAQICLQLSPLLTYVIS